MQNYKAIYCVACRHTLWKHDFCCQVVVATSGPLVSWCQCTAISWPRKTEAEVEAQYQAELAEARRKYAAELSFRCGGVPHPTNDATWPRPKGVTR